MVYDIYKSNGTLIAVIPDGGLDNSTSLTLFGKGRKNWGAEENENLVHIMENFAAGTPPSNPTTGQLWFDISSNTLKLFDITGTWLPVSVFTQDLGIFTANVSGKIVVGFQHGSSVIGVFSPDAAGSNELPVAPINAQTFFPYGIKPGITLNNTEGNGLYGQEELHLGLMTNPVSTVVIQSSGLQITTSSPELALTKTDTTSNYTLSLISDTASIVYTTSSTDGFMNFDVVPSGNNRSLFRYFRNTNTTGQKGIIIYKGDNTNTIDGQIGTGGFNSFFNVTSANFGIGTTTPKSKFDVLGTGNVTATIRTSSANSIAKLDLVAGDTAGTSIVSFSRESSPDAGYLRYTHASNVLDFMIGGTSILHVSNSSSIPKVGINNASPSVSLDLSSGNAIAMPIGNSAKRPSSPNAGYMRYLATENQALMEMFSGGVVNSWIPVRDWVPLVQYNPNSDMSTLNMNVSAIRSFDMIKIEGFNVRPVGDTNCVLKLNLEVNGTLINTANSYYWHSKFSDRGDESTVFGSETDANIDIVYNVVNAPLKYANFQITINNTYNIFNGAANSYPTLDFNVQHRRNDEFIEVGTGAGQVLAGGNVTGARLIWRRMTDSNTVSWAAGIVRVYGKKWGDS